MNKNTDKKQINMEDIEPKMRFDAFTAGIQNGGLRSVVSINMLVCYIVANVDGKVTADNIIEAMAEGMLVNHFEITDAIANLKNNGVIKEEEDGALVLCQGQNEVELIEKDLPLSVRDKSIKLCQKIIAREKYKRDNKVDIEKTENGYNVTLRVSDIDTDFMTLRLYAPTMEQAELIKSKFITDPISVYEKLIEAIFENDY